MGGWFAAATPQNNLRIFGAESALLYGEALPPSAEGQPEPEPEPESEPEPEPGRRRLRWLQEVCAALYQGELRGQEAVLAWVQDLAAMLLAQRRLLERLVQL